jgi:hypothetical protein
MSTSPTMAARTDILRRGKYWATLKNIPYLVPLLPNVCFIGAFAGNQNILIDNLMSLKYI